MEKAGSAGIPKVFPFTGSTLVPTGNLLYTLLMTFEKSVPGFIKLIWVGPLFSDIITPPGWSNVNVVGTVSSSGI